MNGDSISKKSATSFQCPNPEPHKCSIRRCADKRHLYRRLQHERTREEDNRKNRERYHRVYKLNLELMEQRKRSWREYAKRQGKEWQRKRSRAYAKPYAQLSASQRSKIRIACKIWTQLHKKERAEYAKEWRRRDPAFGFRKEINSAKRSGDLGKLAEKCLDAIIRAYEKGRG